MEPLLRPSAEMNSGARKLDREKLKKACEEFESIFILEMLKSMRQTVPQTGFLGNGTGKEIYQNLLDQELSKSLSRRGVMGLGRLVYQQWVEREERNQPGVKGEKLFPSGDEKPGERREE